MLNINIITCIQVSNLCIEVLLHFCQFQMNVQPLLSLPSHQDCHEMWSKKKKKKEGKAAEGPPSEKPRLHNPPKGGGGGGRTQSISPNNHQVSSSSLNRHEPVPPNDSSRSGRGEGGGGGGRVTVPPHNLSVPLPPAPLSTSSILESLNSSLADGGMAAVSGSGHSSNESLHLKKVIAKAQRSLIKEITQTLEKGGMGEPAMVASISGRATQSFDYGNQSNKDLEKAAAAQLYRNKDRDYF